MSSRGDKESTSRDLHKFSVDDKVEVLSSEEGFAEAWAHAVIVSHYKGGEVVEYSKFVSSETGRNLKEKVRALEPVMLWPPPPPQRAQSGHHHADRRPPAPQVPHHRLRHVPVFPSTFAVREGVMVEGYLHDCWWPGEVVEEHWKKGLRVAFTDGDTAWLGRRYVRPMLLRAPRLQADGSEASLDTARTPPPPRLPVRFPHDVNPHDAIAATAAIVGSRDLDALTLDALQAELEAKLRPALAAGWLADHRVALLLALERALNAQLDAEAAAAPKEEAPPRKARKMPAPPGGAAPAEPKRPRANGGAAARRQSSTEGAMLTRPLLRSGAAAGALVSFLRKVAPAPDAAAARYVLAHVGPQARRPPASRRRPRRPPDPPAADRSSRPRSCSAFYTTSSWSCTITHRRRRRRARSRRTTTARCRAG